MTFPLVLIVNHNNKRFEKTQIYEYEYEYEYEYLDK